MLVAALPIIRDIGIRKLKKLIASKNLSLIKFLLPKIIFIY